MKRLIVSADDFGMSESVNEAVEIAHREGLLSTASLMVAGPAAADAVRRAQGLPNLRVGLHLVLVEGHSILPSSHIPALVDRTSWFPSNQVRLGFKYFFHPAIRAQLAKEIRAQFQAFGETGLNLDHVNAHKHMHLHPTVARLALSIGREFGCKAIRLPRQARSPGIGAHMLNAWTTVLRWQAKRAGMVTNDYVLGLSQSGHFGEQAFVEGLRTLPTGVTEAYFHPATISDDTLRRTMPDYDHTGELAALLSPLARDEITRCGIELTTYTELAAA